MLHKLKNIPDTPGIYQFFDERGKLLYVGKAKSLKNRVKSYFRFAPSLSPAPNLGSRIFKMISEAVNLEYIILNSESDALVLENSLIKQLKPKYNILLRDDKTYPYIFVDLAQKYPRFEITRKVVGKGKNIKYFGPFVGGSRELLDALYENFKLVQKANCLKSKKACLFFQIDRCLAPCEFDVSEEAYKKIVDEAIKSINNAAGLLKKLESKMFRLSEEFRFEEAAAVRDKIVAIKKITIASEVDLAKNDNFDLFAVARSANTACVVRFFVRDGKLISSSHSFVGVGYDDDTEETEEMYTQALLEFYTKEHPVVVPNIYTLHDIKDKEPIEELISSHFGKTIKISTPTKKEHQNIAAIALKNGFELLRQRGESANSMITGELKELLELQKRVMRVETFDNSHLFGSSPVASMVVWEDGFKKEEYRHYNLESTSEYEQMREVLTKRALSFDKNPPPDLWLLDGGKANLSLAIDILDSAGVNIDVAAIAKEKIDGKAHRAKSSANDLIYIHSKTIKLPPSDKRLQFLQNLRDEAHRFAVTFHRKQKGKKDREIELMKLKGIKEAKIQRLLDYFGSFEAIRVASIEELTNALNGKDATLIYDFYRK